METEFSNLADAQHHLDLANSCEERGEYEDALRECEAAIVIDPSLAEAHNLRGIVLEELGRSEEAAHAYQEAVRLAPNFTEAAENLSEVESEGKRQAEKVAPYARLRTLAKVLRVLAWVFAVYEIPSVIFSVSLSLRREPFLNLPQMLSWFGTILIGVIIFVILLTLSRISSAVADIAASATDASDRSW
ncbi:MAG: tetratricopeptide repeat protein [Anaerolineae bacterium]|nr:tetratricopeptide repeat protein [Anaerolineae bacterium]